MSSPSAVNSSTSPRSAHLTGSSKFAIFPMEWMPHIKTFRDLRVFLAILAHVGHDGWCWPSIATISRFSNLENRHVIRSIRALESLGAVHTEHRKNKPSRYHVIPCPHKVVAESAMADLTHTPHKVVADLTPTPGRFDAEPLAESATQSNHVNIHKVTSRVRANDDGIEKTTDEVDDASSTAIDRRALIARIGRDTTHDENQILQVCDDWARGISKPLPKHLVPVLHALRNEYPDLPYRPGTPGGLPLQYRNLRDG